LEAACLDEIGLEVTVVNHSSIGKCRRSKVEGKKVKTVSTEEKKLFYFCLFEEFLLRCSVGASEQQKKWNVLFLFFTFARKKEKKTFLIFCF
jgi:hypothetical protein